MPSQHGTIHIEAALTNLSLRYGNGGFIGEEVLPILNVAKDNDKYFVFGRQDALIDNDTIANGASAPEHLAFKIDSTPSYACERHGHKAKVTDDDKQNADPAVAPETLTVNYMTNRHLLNYEYRVAALVTAAASFSTSGNTATLSGTQQWDNAGFDPSTTPANGIEARIDAAKEAIRAKTGVEPNHIVIPAAVAKVMKRNSQIRDLIKYTQSNLLVNGDLPPTLFNMKVLIPGSIYNSANPGQSESMADVWGKHVLLFYRDKVIGKEIMTFGFTFQSQARQIQSWRDADASRRTTWYEISDKKDEKIVSEYCGYLYRNVIA